MDNTAYYQRNRDVALIEAKEYYKNNNGRLQKQARDKYRNLSEEDKNKMPEENKQKLKEYQREYYETKNNR